MARLFSSKFLLWLFAMLESRNLCAQAPLLSLHTTVSPLAGEDLARPCEYELASPSPSAVFRGVFIVFERGRDIQRFYNDPNVRSFAQQHHLAMMMPHHCASKKYEDIDVDPTKGLGRALFVALDQFATQTKHPELKSAPLVLLGFSGAGAFAGRLVGFAPHRIAAAILAHAGQFDPLGLDTIQLSALSLTVPEFILVGGRDSHVGTDRPYAYFKKYWGEGAPWLFVTQNNVPHCCVVNARDLILIWLDAVLKKRLEPANGDLAPLNKKSGYYAFIQISTTGARDTWNLFTSNAVKPSFERIRKKHPHNEQPAGWLPSKQVAEEWRNFVAQQSHPGASMP